MISKLLWTTNFSFNTIFSKSVLLLFTIGLLMFSHLGYSQLGTDEFTIATDDASNYSSGWNNGDNNGSSFGNWSFSSSGSSGNYIGVTGQANSSFGLFADPGGSFTSARPFNKPLKVEDRISVDIGATNVNNGAELLVQLVDNGGIVFTLKFVGGDTDWKLNDGGSDFSSGEAFATYTSKKFTFTYEGGNDYSYTLGNSSGTSFTANNTISNIDEIRFINNGQGSGENFGFNNLEITSKYTIPSTIASGKSSDVTSNTIVPYLNVQSGGSVTVQAGNVLTVNGDITNQGNITFKSELDDSVTPARSLSAQLDTFTGTILGTGDVTVERFIPVETNNTRAFRFLTSTVDSTDPIFDNWQESGNSPVGFGTHIAGNNDGTNGVDQTITGNPSMYTFDNTNSNGGGQNDDWQAITDTKSKNLIAGEAYRIFIRGDRNYVLDSYPANAPNSDVTLRATGSLLTGSKTISLSATQDFYSLVGNPYQAIVDMSMVMANTSTDNVNTNYYWVWDPNVSTQGAYVAVQLSSGNTFNPGTNGGTAVTSAANEYVMPGQSFFVQTATDATADLEFTEASKSVTQSSTAVFSENTLPSINLKLYKTTDLNAQDIESDALQIDFSDQFSNAATMEDADKLGNPSENLARLNNGTDYLSIEKRELPTDGESLELFTDGYEVSDYTFVADLSNLPNGTVVSLSDNYTGNITLLNDGETEIQFTVDESIPGSIATDRFSLDFELETFSVDHNALADSFKVYPNPVTDGQVNIKTSNFEGEATVNLYNMMGQLFIEAQKSFEANGKMNINLGNLQSGVYFIEINQKGVTAKERLIIN